ncbi:MAG TPA: hypothetical protein VFP27_13375, partial [Mycobacterium sp.]|nr:hypothetical protein [Mycobacterium sp.]
MSRAVASTVTCEGELGTRRSGKFRRGDGRGEPALCTTAAGGPHKHFGRDMELPWGPFVML